MRIFSTSTVLLLLGLVGYGASVGFASTTTGGDRGKVVETLDMVFGHTQNLRGGDGRRCAGHARRPGIPFFFHVEKKDQRAIDRAETFGLDEGLGVYALQAEGDLDDPTVPFGTLYFKDAAKKVSAGHAVMASSGPGFPSWSKIDAVHTSGTLEGIAYKSAVTLDADRRGAIQAAGTHPAHGRYTLKGAWQASNAGTWNQRWDLAKGAWEKDAYATKADGTSVLKVQTSAGVNLDLAFSHDLSGRGTVSGLRRGDISWNVDGDGAIKWADGETQTFEDWKL